MELITVKEKLVSDSEFLCFAKNCIHKEFRVSRSNSFRQQFMMQSHVFRSIYSACYGYLT